MLGIDLNKKIAFVAGVADDKGYGWAIAKALAEAGATVLIGTWPPVFGIFQKSWESGRLDSSRKLSDGSLFELGKIYPLDASFDTREEVPDEVRENKRWAKCSAYSISEVSEAIKRDWGHVDLLVHSLANGPEAHKSLLETSREGYLAAVSSSSYSHVSLLSHLGPIMTEGGAALSLSYLAAEKAIPGYGGGLNAAKAALESDTRLLAYEAGRKWGIRVNCISAGPWKSRAAKAIGFIEQMVAYCAANSPLNREMRSEDVGNAAAFLLSPLASAITGEVLHVDNGLGIMGLASDSCSLSKEGS